MLTMALRQINFAQVAKVLLSAILVFTVAASLFFPTEVFAQESSFLTCPPVGQCVQIGFTALVNSLVAVAAWVLYWAGTLFEIALHYSITTNYNDLSAVKSGWIVLRDLVNLLFIFILLYIAIGTVLQLGSVNWKKQLAAIIIAAVLVNFSLFLTRVVIDASNIVAFGIYKKVTACEEPPETPASERLCTGNAGPEGSITLSEAIMNGIQLPKSFSEAAFGEDARSHDGLRNGLVRLGLILLLVWAFISVAILFIGRTIVFVFLLVTSPIGVAGASLPMLQQPAKQWRENLFNQSLVAPIFLLFMYIILKMAVDLKLGAGTVSESSGDPGFRVGGPMGDAENGQFWLNFVILLGFIIAAVNITKRYSGEVGRAINKAAGAAIGVGLGVATGGAALAARQSIGRASTMALQGRAGKALMASAERGNAAALASYNTLKRGASSSFDVRNTAVGAFGAKQASRLGGVAGLSAMTGAKAGQGGRLKRIKDIVEKDNKQYEDLSAEGIRKFAEKKEAKGKEEGKWWTTKGTWTAAAGVNKARGKALNEMATRKDTSKEEREKKFNKELENIRKVAEDPTKAKEIIGKMKPDEIAKLPEDILTKEGVISSLDIGELKAMSGKISQNTRKAIMRSPSLSTKALDWASDPENGFI